MSTNTIVRYNEVERVVISYIRDLYFFSDRGAETVALYYTLNMLSRIPESSCVAEYELCVLEELERLMTEYQGNKSDCGHGRGAIGVVLERVRGLFFNAKQTVQRPKINKITRKIVQPVFESRSYVDMTPSIGVSSWR